MSIIDDAIDAIKRNRWHRWLHSLDNDFLKQVHTNFVRRRDDNPDGDSAFSRDEFDRRIALLEAVIASRG